MTSMTSSVEWTDLDFKISVALPWVLGFLWSTQSRYWPDCVNVQADLSLCCKHIILLILSDIWLFCISFYQLCTDMISFWLTGRRFEPAHEIMILFVLHKHILQTCMLSHPVGLNVWFLVLTLHQRTAKALARLHRCVWAVMPEPSLFPSVISTIISWAGSFVLQKDFLKISRIPHSNKCPRRFLRQIWANIRNFGVLKPTLVAFGHLFP